MIVECRAVWIEVKSWESAWSRSGELKSKAQSQAALAMESLEIMSTLRPQQAGNLGEALPPPDMGKDEIFLSIQKFQEWMGTAVASFAKQGARSILAVINDSDGTNEKCEGLVRLAES